MANQSSITEYFNSRKRQATDDLKRIGQQGRKVMIIEKNSGDVFNCPKFDIIQEDTSNNKSPTVKRQPIYVEKQNELLLEKYNGKTFIKGNDSSYLRNKIKGTKQLDIRKTFSFVNRSSSSSRNIQNFSSEIKNSDNRVAETICHTPTKKDLPSKEVKLNKLTQKEQIETKADSETNLETVNFNLPEEKIDIPKKENNKEQEDENIVCATDIEIGTADLPKEEADGKRDAPSTPNKNTKPKRELNLEEIKAKLKNSSRVGNLKASLNKLNEGFAKLDKIREKKLSSEKLTIKKFDSVSFDVLTSPSKTPVKVYSGMSPAKLREAVFRSPGGKPVAMETKYVSPRKLFDEPSTLGSPTKEPAFQRYQALVSEGRSALTLPFKYRSLAEIFRGIETIVSMMYNRGEIITFTKLKNAVQQLTRRNLYEKHLSQIITVYPDAYVIVYEKIHSNNKLQPEQYDIVLRPVLNKENSKAVGSSSSKMEMNPEIMLERRRTFYQSLLSKAKVYHEKFLLSLDPPILVNREAITRWHPDFEVDGLPDIEESPLPEPPNVARVASAKDVLERARNLFGNNARLDNAMQKLTEQKNAANSSCPAPSATTSTAAAMTALTNAMKGIPKSLLEKVRAKQAAKALEAMTRSPMQAKEAVRLTRLPEIARIVRNIFITEKKLVLMRETVVKKLSDSYRENLSASELDIHLDMLREKAPELISFCTLRKTNFIKFVKEADMQRIMARLVSIASENNY